MMKRKFSLKDTEKEALFYIRPSIPCEDKFFAQRVRKWVLHPEYDPELTADIEAGKYPDLAILFKDSLI
ncbi:hypothetical protein [Propionispira arboris]|uniref:hypothetical protein n=1 Tax=Propionispira arboris TaxID=84035 RepID=UPI00115FCEB2|nr:hypothetical protein [Propionispira arboris]